MRRENKFKRTLSIILSLILLLSITKTVNAKSGEAGTTSFDPKTGDVIFVNYDYLAEPQEDTFKVDGTSLTVRSYYIDGHEVIYVKIRDIANGLKNTSKKFSVTVNAKKKTLTIKPGKKYTPIGKENKQGDGNEYEGRNILTLYKNNQKVKATVLTINNEHYVALKTLAKIVGFSTKRSMVDYDYLYNIVTLPAPTLTPTPVPSPSQVFADDTTGLIRNPFPNAKLTNNPKTVDDCFDLLCYLIINNQMEYTFKTDVPYADAVKEGGLIDLLKQAANPEQTPELFYGAICHTDITMKEDGLGTSVTVKFKGWSSQTGNDLAKLNYDYFTKAIQALQRLVSKGKLKSSMTEMEKAKNTYKWIVLNISPVIDEFDKEPFYMKENSSTGYAAIVDRNTTSIGYTALYNLMCRYLGLTNIKTMTGTSFDHPHMWTFQELDGKKVITDVKNGYAGMGVDGFQFTPAYFAIHTHAPETDEYFHYLKWDKEKYADCVSNFEYVEIVYDGEEGEFEMENSDNEDYFESIE